VASLLRRCCGGAVNSDCGAFLKKLLHNYIINIKKKFFFRSKRQRNFSPFFFASIRELNQCSPLVSISQLIITLCSGLQPGAALVVVCLAVVTLPVAGCRLVGCGVVSGRPLRSRAVVGMSQHVGVCLWPVLASHVPSPPAAAAADWRGQGWVPMEGWSYVGVGPERGLRGAGRRGWCEEWARADRLQITRQDAQVLHLCC
jgi:hypothetical protein